MTTGLITPETTAFEKKALSVLEQARAIVITSAEQFQAAATFLIGLKGYAKELDATFDPTIAAAHAAHKTAVGAKAKHALPIKEAETLVKREIASWAEKEKDRLENVRREAEAAERQRIESEKLAVAADLEKNGDHAEAAAILAEPVVVAMAPKPEAPKAAGVGLRDKWDAELVDIKALARAVADGSAPASLLSIDATGARKFAEATKGGVPVAGLRFVKTQVVSARS